MLETGAPGGPTTPDLTDLDLFDDGFPHEVFADLRRETPLFWHPPTEHTPDGVGFWVVTTHELAREVAADPGLYSSAAAPGQEGGGTLIEDLPVGLGPGVLLNMSDDPRHSQFRKLLTPSVLPKALRTIEDDLRSRSRSIVDDALEKGECDFVLDVAAELPLQAVSQLIGVPQEDRHRLFGWANATLDYDGRELGQATERSMQAAAEMYAYGAELLASKRESPGSDLISVVAQATIDGQPLSEFEIQMLFNLLMAAGSETTRNSITLGLLGILAHEGMWQRLAEDPSLVPGAVEEMLRFASSTPYNRRSATRTHHLGGETIAAGDKVTVWWASANRDEAVFARPDVFDPTRNPNPHLAFGRGGHFCLGAPLARLEMTLVLEALLESVERIEQTGPVEYSRSNKHSGVRRMPVRMVKRDD
ncbi:cytochrome P450 [Nocardioides marmorisolisilvae]|uniref:Cytochrome P450 n=1 Tax=Nocardioides marmorisolisilvae TaxID=1542737 RepID=A0A3N0DVW6_9ACTN|nr:cytochrome P450 [Nocardioides marmorisolisilvae]RNL79636.1 cytochrome P450 [Nocardioides marmorisolisilvae]